MVYLQSRLTRIVSFVISPLVLLLIGVSLATASQTGAAKPSSSVYSRNVAATVRHLTRVKILESNNVILRRGSIYDNATYFESLLDVPLPGYNYEFLDTGLGASEPLYPMYQKGHQGSYAQLLPAFISERARHIDHYSNLITPEGCRVEGIYLLRGIDEYPRHRYAAERKQGFKLIVVRLDYYTRLKSDAQCGRHRANDPDPKFDPSAFVRKYHNAMTLEDFPQKELARFEAKVSAIYHIRQTMNPSHHRKFNLNDLQRNSLWYYPDGHAPDFGIRSEAPQPTTTWFNQPKHMAVDASARLQADFPLAALLGRDDFARVLDFINGKPTEEFDAGKEPGHDTLRLADVTPKNFYTSGLELEPIRDVRGDVSDPRNFKLVGMTIKPYEEQEDPAWQGTRVIPQIRFVYQLMDPRHPERAFEQMFLHLKWDVVDRWADEQTRRAQHRYFLSRVDQLTHARETTNPAYDEIARQFIIEFTSARPSESIAVSSALTGIWVFGALIRDRQSPQQLNALRIVRDGVDVGYYSSSYDNDIFRAALARASGIRKQQLQKHMDDLTVDFFRDPKRQDAHAINFNRVTCAQCHQTSGRDGVHMSFNDGLDRRLTAPSFLTEYFFHDATLQLRNARDYWREESGEN